MLFVLCGAAGFRISEALGIGDRQAYFVRFRNHQRQAAGTSLQSEDPAEDDERHPRRGHPSSHRFSFESLCRWTKVWISVRFSDRKTTLFIEHHPSPSAPGSQRTQLHQSPPWNAQGWEPCLSAFSEHISEELHRLPQRAVRLLDGARGKRYERPL